jgi:OOP family OmpA-OmpF porin
MKRLSFLFMLILLSTQVLPAQEQDEIISLFEGSEKIYDDNIGFETHYYMTGPNSYETVDGKIRRQFCQALEGVSVYEVIKNYEKAIQSKNGTIFHFTRKVESVIDKETGEEISYGDLFTKDRSDHGHNAYATLGIVAQNYVFGKTSTAKNDLYISVAAVVHNARTYYTIVTVLAEPMDMNKVTLNVLNDGIADKGKVAIYDIYFDTGKSEVKSESTIALEIIATYLKENPNKKFLIVGHTDNTGDFKTNIALSNDRANAVVEKLVAEHEIKQTQLRPYGVGSVSPQMSNDTDEGRARNRRVELVEL